MTSDAIRNPVRDHPLKGLETIGYSLLYPLARVMLTATFIISAVRHATHWSAALNEMAGDGMPRSSVLMLGSIAFRLIGGLCVLLGFRARMGAGLLVVFIVSAALSAHDFWAMPPARQTHELIEFLNNMAMAGGALLIVLIGAGPCSIDALLSDPNALHSDYSSTSARGVVMKLVIGLLLAVCVGIGCRWFGIPLPGPPAIMGAAMAVAMATGNTATDYWLTRKSPLIATPVQKALKSDR